METNNNELTNSIQEENERLKKQLQKSNNWKYIVGIVALLSLAIFMIVINGNSTKNINIGGLCLFKFPLSANIACFVHLIENWQYAFKFLNTLIASLSETYITIWSIIKACKLFGKIIKNNKKEDK